MPHKYDFQKIEKKWQKKWLTEGVYEPNLARAKRPFYNLMMFPYPSAEGLHVGNMYAFTGTDIYGRLKRMQGHDVFEPIGLDGFGIHSENYALKIGAHPMKQAKVSEKRFYKQLEAVGNGYAWKEHLETYDPEYYKWTQWIFVQMFKHGLAYRKKQPVNWCPSCKTVLADEQVISGECERCGTKVIKKDLEQWFFRITKYADKLLRNLDGLDWSEKVKIAQRNWLGKSEGAELDFEVKTETKPNFLILHGYTGRANKNFIPWLKKELEIKGFKVQAPQMPNTNAPQETEQIGYVLQKCRIDENTVVIGHSLGGVVAMKVLEKRNKPIAGLVLIAPAVEPKFRTGAQRPFWKTFVFKYNYEKLKKLIGFRIILSDTQEASKRGPYLKYLSDKISAPLYESKAEREHFCANKEPFILKNLRQSITVFTTRPDTLFGATYMVLAPEHPLIQNLESKIKNLAEVKRYVARAKKKTEEERIAEGKEKTGVELKGVKAINPATKKEIPIWVADYVLSSYGTGAIMAVPAHDVRDLEFADKFKLPMLKVVKPVLTSNPLGSAQAVPPQVVVESECWEGEGEMINSGRFDGMPSEKAKWEITKVVSGKKQVQFRLRDWLLSRQRYWGPPIPMVHCSACEVKGRGERKEMPGWYAVPEGKLPVRLPLVKNFRPKGKGESPLASVKSFYETKCPACGGKARRETDVSDTFLDSAWYYLRYPSVREKNKPWSSAVSKKWLPVNTYIGGAEHSVLHLLYVRFLALALHDMKLLDFGESPAPKGEPFPKFRAHGLLIKEGAKMSKSKGNVVNPDEYIQKFGADTLRMYLMFLAPFEQGGDFRDAGVLGISRFLARVWNFGQSFSAARPPEQSEAGVFRLLNQTIKKVGEDIENLRYNTAISALMIMLNKMESAELAGVSRLTWEDFLKLLAPFAPHITEELWEQAGGKGSIHASAWPKHEEKMLRADSFQLVIQINGKLRDNVEVPVDTNEEKAREIALAREKIRTALGGQHPRRVIYVPGRLINLVV